MVRKLSAKGYNEPDIQLELDRLVGERLLDDRRFAESYVNYRIGRGYGPVKIGAELRQRGIDESLAREVFDELDVDWSEYVHSAWCKKFNTVAQDYREHARQARFLQQRGFTTDQITRVLNSDL